MRTFVIADSSKRKAKPVGIITWKPGLEDNQGVFALELCSDCDEESLPLSLSFCTRRENRCATAKESEDWVNSRIVPESRHNIAEVLRAISGVLFCSLKCPSINLSVPLLTSSLSSAAHASFDR